MELLIIRQETKDQKERGEGMSLFIPRCSCWRGRRSQGGMESHLPSLAVWGSQGCVHWGCQRCTLPVAVIPGAISRTLESPSLACQSFQSNTAIYCLKFQIWRRVGITK